MNIYNKESLMTLTSHILIQQLKRQPRIGGGIGDFNKELEQMNKKFKEMSDSSMVVKLSNQIDSFKGTIPSLNIQMKNINDVLTSQLKSFEMLSAGIGRAQAYQDEYNKSVLVAVKNQNFLEESNKELNKSFGMSSKGATKFAYNLRKLTIDVEGQTNSFKLGSKKLFEYAKNLKEITGGFIASSKALGKDFGKELIKIQGYLQNNIGLSAESANSFELYAAGIGKSGAEAAGEIEQMSRALEGFTGIDAVQQQQQIIQDIASMGADLQLQYGGVGNKLEVATMKARLLGTSMEKLHGTGQSLLNIESSIGSEMEYQQLTGRRLLDNQGKSLTNEYRMATISGDSTKQAELMNQFIASEGDTLEKNLFARKKAAELMGTDEVTLAKMIQKRKLMTKLGAEDIMNMSADEAKTEIERLRKEAGDDEAKLKDIDQLIAASDTRTTADKANDFLQSIDSKISNAAVNEMGGAKAAAASVSMAQANANTNSLVKFAENASKTFSDPQFIKGVGSLGIISDRIAAATTPISMLAKVLPKFVSEPLTKFTNKLTSITNIIAKPKASEVAVTPIESAAGGYITGAGTSTSDSIPARLSDGEYVINAAATRRNKPLLDKINNGPIKMANGGSVSSNAKMEMLLQRMLTVMQGSGIMGESALNGRKRV